MQTRKLPADDPQAISTALQILKDGGVVAFPTDTVYGLGAPAFAPDSIERLYEIKGREHTKAIALLLAEPAAMAQVARPSEAADKLAAAFWPGPLTLVLQRQPRLPVALSPNDTIGVRVPDHPVARALLAAAGPMAVTSANLSGGANALNGGDVMLQLDGRIELVLDGGQTPGERPSTVVDLTGEKPKVLREGPVTAAQIAAALK